MTVLNKIEILTNLSNKKGALINNGPIIYLHIPKAAGNSSISFLKQSFPNALSINWRNIDESWQQFLDRNPTNKYELVSGHINYSHIDKYSSAFGNMFTAITFLRHPIDRLISQYRYMTTAAHPDHNSFKKMNPNFEKWVLNIRPNIISYLLVGGGRSSTEIINKLSKYYHFIGLTEFYHTSMVILSNSLGIKYTVEKKINITNSNEVKQIEISHSLYKKLHSRHSLDIALYNELHNLYSKISDNLISQMIICNS
jgi:hypothetical protein